MPALFSDAYFYISLVFDLSYKISQKVRTAKSWLKVCFLISFDVSVTTVATFDIRPKSPTNPKRTPSHQNSNLFHTCNTIYINKVVFLSVMLFSKIANLDILSATKFNVI